MIGASAPVHAALSTWERRGPAAAGVLLALFALAVGAAAAPFSYDDAWITFRYASNFASGGGLVYNPGERVFGTSAPGYALLLGLLSMPAPSMVSQVSAVVCTVALATAGVALYVFGVRRGSALAGFVAGLVFVVNPLALESFGGEMVPQAALAVWAVTAVALDRPAVATACALAATLVRPDGLLVLAVALGWHGVRTSRVPWRLLAASALVLGIWFAALWWWFGVPLPDTLAAKQAQRASGAWRSLGTDLFFWLCALAGIDTPFSVTRTHSGFFAFLILALAGLLILPWRRAWWPMVAWPLLACVAYRQLRLPFYHWYAVPALVLLAVCAGLAGDALARGLTATLRGLRRVWASDRSPTFVARAVVGAIVCATIVWPLTTIAFDTRRWFPGPGERAYIGIGQWLADNTPPEATVGYIEIGFVGWHARRHMIDPFGLVTTGVGDAVARRDFLYAYRTRRPDYILHSPVFFPDHMGRLEREPWFAQAYRPIATLPSGRSWPLTVYRRTQSAQRTD